MKPERKQNRKGTLENELHEQRREGLKPRARQWGGRRNAQEERRDTKRQIREAI